MTSKFNSEENPQELVDQFSKPSLPSTLSVGILPAAYGSTVWLRDGQEQWKDLFAKWTSLLESSPDKPEGPKFAIDAEDSRLVVDLRTNDETHRVIDTKTQYAEMNKKGHLVSFDDHPGILGEPVSAITPEILDQFNSIEFVVPIVFSKWSSEMLAILALGRFTFSIEDGLWSIEQVDWSPQYATKVKRIDDFLPGLNYDEFTKEEFVSHQDILTLVEGRKNSRQAELESVFNIINQDFPKEVVGTIVSHGGRTADLAQLRDAIFELPEFVNKKFQELLGSKRAHWEVLSIQSGRLDEESVRSIAEHQAAKKEARKNLAAVYAAKKK